MTAPNCYYGTVRAPESERVLLESLGLEVGRHMPQAGVFHLRATAEAKTALDDLQADFPATLFLRENDHEEIKNVLKLSADGHCAEIAYAQYMANAIPPRSGGREYWEHVESVHRAYAAHGAAVPPERNEPPPEMVLYSPANKWIVAVLDDDGTSQQSHQRVMLVRGRFPDAVLMTFSAAEKAIDEAYCTNPEAISAEDFESAFGCMPPVRSTMASGMHLFRLSELYENNVGTWYTRQGDQCYKFRGHKDMAIRDVVQTIHNASRAASAPTPSGMT